jgi:hypothetical protein
VAEALRGVLFVVDGFLFAFGVFGAAGVSSTSSSGSGGFAMAVCVAVSSQGQPMFAVHMMITVNVNVKTKTGPSASSQRHKVLTHQDIRACPDLYFLHKHSSLPSSRIRISLSNSLVIELKRQLPVRLHVGESSKQASVLAIQQQTATTKRMTTKT